MPTISTEALQTLVETIGYDPRNLTVDQKTDIANRLSQIANRSDPWTWRYVHNVAGKINASREMMDAILRLGAILDGAPESLAMGKPVQCIAIGQVAAGALILADSRRCHNLQCGLQFVPTAHNQRYHSRACKRAWERVKRQQLQKEK